jgi:hypothetical protein
VLGEDVARVGADERPVASTIPGPRLPSGPERASYTAMSGKIGDRIIVESETVRTPSREGEIVEVIEGEGGIRYRIRWSDGQESLFTPGGGSARIVSQRSS